MADSLNIEHATLGLMGPIVYTTTRVMPIHCVIFQVGERVILLDSGFGTREMLDPNSLLGDEVLWRVFPLIDSRMTAYERLKTKGIRPDLVTDVVLTHLDYDHAGGIYDFPDATGHVSEEELDAFDSAEPRGPYRRYQISHSTRVKTYGSSDERWFDLEARSLDLPGNLDTKLIPLPGHTAGHCGVAYREDGKWSLHAGDAYFDHQVNFLEDAPGLPIEIGFQNSAAERQASLGKLRTLKAQHGDEVELFCTHDQHEFLDWTTGCGNPDPLSEPFTNTERTASYAR